MKRLQSLLDDTFGLLLVLALAIAAIVFVSGQALTGFSGGATSTIAQDAAQPKGKAAIFQSPLSPPTPVPTPTPLPGAGNLKIIAIEPVKNGPYQNIVWSPDGKKALVSKQYTPYLLARADGSNAKLVTEQAEGSYYEWSPNGEWLVFNTFRDVDDPTVDERDPGLRGLWGVKADGSEVHPLQRTEGWRTILSPAWSPDSSMVVFIEFLTVEKPDSPKGVFWEGSLRVADVKKGEAILLEGLPEREEAPARVWWSPDGQHLFVFKDGFTPESPSYRLTLATHCA